MIRILIVDDEDISGFVSSLKREIEGSTKSDTDVIHINPTDGPNNIESSEGIAKLELSIKNEASNYWNLAAFDINLGDAGKTEENNIRITLQLVEAFRENNKAATVLLYSGSIARMMEIDSTKRKTTTEGVLKRIFRAQIAGFVSRNDISTEIQVSVANPTWLLRVDKLMEQHADKKVSTVESAFTGKTFTQLSQCFRSQDMVGEKLANHIAELGIAGLVDLHS